MSAWDHLPNARHIDWVIESLKTHTELWYGAQGLGVGAGRCVATSRTTACYVVWGSVGAGADLLAAYDASYDAVRSAAWDASQDADRNAPRVASQDAILALIAYDNCEQYLSMTSEELHAWALLSEHPAAVLLLPMVVVREQIEQLSAA